MNVKQLINILEKQPDKTKIVKMDIEDVKYEVNSVHFFGNHILLSVYK